LLINGDTGTVGITDYAQHELGDVVFVELPDVGQSFSQGQPFGSVESVKAVSEIFAPTDGEVIAINDKLVKEPELINSEPYGAGWIIKLRVKNPKQRKELLSAADYGALTDHQAH
jgi:glycine cleavage system H protein